MKINNTPRRTSKNFRINNIEIEDNLLNKKLNPFDSFTFENIKLKKINSNVEIKYGVEKTNQINNGNFKYELEIIDNKKYGIINFDVNSDLVDLIELNINKDSNYLINYSSKSNNYHNGLIKATISDNVKANIIVVNNFSSESTNLISFDNLCNENVILNYLIVDLGGNTSISNYYTCMKGNNSKNNLNSIYIGNKKQVFDINYLVEIYGQNNEVNIGDSATAGLSRESRDKVKNAVNALLSSLTVKKPVQNPINMEEDPNVIQAEVVDND
jgi:Fe-S cluster assembly scaffold protein SufB